MVEIDKTWNSLLRPGDASVYFTGAHPEARSGPAFSPGDCRFSPANAWWLSEISRLVYRRGIEEWGPLAPLPTRDGILRSVGLREYRFFSVGSTHGALVTPDMEGRIPFAVLVFRGTNGFENWLSNLKTIQVPWPGGGLVHGGFMREFHRIWPEIASVLDEIDAPLFYTGHSLGGALATLAATIRPPRAVYTFGSPRVGDAVFAHTIRDVPIFRVENGRDIVPTVPPSRIPFDFCHVGDPVRIGNIPGRKTPPEEETGESGNGSSSRLAFMAPPDFLSDHSPVNYSTLLTRALAAADGEAGGR